MSHHLPRPPLSAGAALLLLLGAACGLLLPAPTAHAAPVDPFAPAAASETAPAAATGDAPAVHPRGEWYQIGYQMALESRSSYHLMQISDADAIARLPRVLSRMTVNEGDLREPDLALLRQGWAHGILGQPQAMGFPPDQHASLLPAALKGFHKFPADIEAEKKALEDAEKARVAAEMAKAEAERLAREEAARLAREEADRKAHETLADKAERWRKAVVKVKVTLEGGSAHGTGFFIGPGLIVTNHHVIDEAQNVTVVLEANQRSYPAVVVAHTEVPDIALLRIAWQDNASLPFGNADHCRELEEIVMIGYPRYDNISATYVKGSISAAKRIYNYGDDSYDCLQMDIRTYGGNSGGPVINAAGQVVGLHTFGDPNPKLSQFTFSQRSNFLLSFLRSYAKGQYTYLAE